MDNVMIANAVAYKGLHVTTRDYDSKEVVSSSKDPLEAYQKALDAGIEDPVLVYMPRDEEESLIL